MRQYSGIGVLDKAMTVLHAVAEQPCVLADLCERTGLPRATAHRLAVGLEIHQLLSRNDAGVWSLGPGLAKLASHAADSLAEAASSVLPRLREATEESVQVYRRDGDRRICVAS
ncbi:MAG: helix-turn-helix domain-containing protein, partial [Dietzia sp.]|nr:helix-turn-helix domain-containing protein [Dietzia sp.]